LAQQTQQEQAGHCVYAFVSIFRCLVQDVRVFQNAEDAEKAYEAFCGVAYNKGQSGQVEVHSDFEDSDILETVLQ